MPGMRPRDWISVLAAIGFGVVWLVLVAGANGQWDKSTIAGLGQAVGTFLAIGAALWIGIRDRREADKQAHDERVQARESFVRRRDYDECIRLLELVERDRQQWEASPDHLPRSIEATALIRALWGRRNWWGAAADWYIESRRPGSRYSELKPDDPAVGEVFATIEREIVEMIMKLDFQDREPATSEPGDRPKLWLAHHLERAARFLRSGNPSQ